MTLTFAMASVADFISASLTFARISFLSTTIPSSSALSKPFDAFKSAALFAAAVASDSARSAAALALEASDSRTIRASARCAASASSPPPAAAT
jgi:hypothetical protein